MVQRYRKADRIYTFFISQFYSFPTPLGPLHPSLLFWFESRTEHFFLSSIFLFL